MTKEEAKIILDKHLWEYCFFWDEGESTILNKKRGKLYGVSDGGFYIDEYGSFFDCFEPIPKKKERLLTVDELRGKWSRCGIDEIMVTEVIDNEKIFIPNWCESRDLCFLTVETLHKKEFTLLDGSSLKVEVENDN